MQFTNSSNPNDLLAPLPLEFNEHWPRGRQCSVSSTTSSCTTSSRASSPTDAWPARRASISTRTIRRHHPYLPADKYRAVLSSTYDNADAMLVLPLPAEALDENNKPIPEKLQKYKSGKAYLVVGPLAYELRDPQNRARLRAAVHPYRFVPRNPSPPSPIATPTLPDAMRRVSMSSDVSDADTAMTEQ
ncbi:hypothetical protein C8Q80DRAFT_1112775 [Daedaleopsis nitida]|nr:hypothetical protein C8Q80DRAFT_1112775 [Daedaleopsis nitida]